MRRESVKCRASLARYGDIITDEFSDLSVPHELGKHDDVPIIKLMTNSGCLFGSVLVWVGWGRWAIFIKFDVQSNQYVD